MPSSQVSVPRCGFSSRPQLAKFSNERGAKHGACVTATAIIDADALEIWPSHCCQSRRHRRHHGRRRYSWCHSWCHSWWWWWWWWCCCCPQSSRHCRPFALCNLCTIFTGNMGKLQVDKRMVHPGEVNAIRQVFAPKPGWLATHSDTRFASPGHLLLAAISDRCCYRY